MLTTCDDIKLYVTTCQRFYVMVYHDMKPTCHGMSWYYTMTCHDIKHKFRHPLTKKSDFFGDDLHEKKNSIFWVSGCRNLRFMS